MSEGLKRVTYADISRISRERAEAERASPAQPASPSSPPIPAIPITPSLRDDGLSGASTKASPADAVQANRDLRASPSAPSDPLYGLRSKLRPGREQLNVRIKADLAEQLEVWCFENRRDKTTAVELALAILFRRGDPSNPANRASPSTSLIIDDYTDDQDRSVVEEYEKLTGKTFNEKDAQDLKAIRSHGVDVYCIVAGMLRTVLNKRQPGPINSFAYMTKEIYKLAERGAPMEMKAFIQMERQKLARKRPRW